MTDSVSIEISTLKEVIVVEKECYCCYLEDGWNGKCNACQQEDKRAKEKKEKQFQEELKQLQKKLIETENDIYFFQDDNEKGRIVSKLLRSLIVMWGK